MVDVGEVSPTQLGFGFSGSSDRRYHWYPTAGLEGVERRRDHTWQS